MSFSYYNKPNDNYKVQFKNSIQNNPAFPKIIEDIPSIAFNYQEEAKVDWENGSFWGGFQEVQAVENGIEKCIGSAREMV